jgi:hypothetical protein
MDKRLRNRKEPKMEVKRVGSEWRYYKHKEKIKE